MKGRVAAMCALLELTDPLKHALFLPSLSSLQPAHVPKSKPGQPKGETLTRALPRSLPEAGLPRLDLRIVSGGVLHVAFLDQPNTQETPGVRRKPEHCPVRLRFPNVGRLNAFANPPRGWGRRSIMNVAYSR